MVIFSLLIFAKTDFISLYQLYNGLMLYSVWLVKSITVNVRDKIKSLLQIVGKQSDYAFFPFLIFYISSIMQCL